MWSKDADSHAGKNMACRETMPMNPAADALRPSAGPLNAVRTDRARLLQLRWVSVLAMAALGLLAIPFLAPAHPVQPLAGVTLALAAVNLALAGGLIRRLDGPWGAFVQLGIDLLAWGAFLYFGGGVTNPAISLLLPLVAVGASILPARQAWALAALAVAVYSLLWQFHHPVHLDDAAMAMYWHLAGMWLSFVLSAATVVWFVARMNTALSRRERDLAEANAARARDAYVVGLGKLAAGAAHRLGTPLGTLRILADELARRGDLADETREDLALMREQVSHCRDILNSLTREAGQQRAEGGGPTTAGAWLEGVVTRWRSLRPHAAASLRCDPADAGAVIVADASLGEALHNLIDNAQDANEAAGRGGGRAAVEVEAACCDGSLVVEVSDRGPGLPQAVCAAVRQGPLAARPAGMGVGLYLAHDAVEHHGGSLDFRPRPGDGTIARLLVPLQDASR